MAAIQSAQPDGIASRYVDPFVARQRIVVMTDIANEPDDQMSLVRLLVYANQFDVEGLVATTSTWLKTGPLPDVILSVLDAYDQVQPNLLKHAPGFPAAANLRKLVVSGQPAYGMVAVGPDKVTPGAELICARRATPTRVHYLGARLGRHEHARAGSRDGSRDAHAW